MTILFAPVYLFFRRGLPYYFALLSHSLVGDYFTAYGVQLFWPVLEEWYVAPRGFLLTGVEQAFFEVGLFMLMVIHILLKRAS
jgi:membrane-bound metal-dependent hydrolase YbcI (DUF457 family)